MIFANEFIHELIRTHCNRVKAFGMMSLKSDDESRNLVNHMNTHLVEEVTAPQIDALKKRK